MKSNGWISIHRKITGNWIWEAKPFSYGQAWIDILIECNHSERKQLIGKTLIKTKRGQSSNSLKTWANRWGWSVSATRHFLGLLENDGMLRTHNARITTLITVCNYDSYQNTTHANGTQAARETNAKQTQEERGTYTNNNDNNNNNDNKERKRRFTPPLYSDVVIQMMKGKNALSQQRAEREADKFINFYTSNGWKVGKNKMVSWPSAVANWLARLEPEEMTVQEMLKDLKD